LLFLVNFIFLKNRFLWRFSISYNFALIGISCGLNIWGDSVAWELIVLLVGEVVLLGQLLWNHFIYIFFGRIHLSLRYSNLFGKILT